MLNRTMRFYRKICSDALALRRIGTSHVPKKFVAHPFAYHEEVAVHIDEVNDDGCGVANHNNWKIIVPFTLPGERVVVRIYRNMKDYSDADVVEIVQKSSDRVEAKCEYFGSCGGCQFQHMSIKAQRIWKMKKVQSLMKTVGITCPINPIISTPHEYGYRSKLTPHYTSSARAITNPPNIGFLGHNHRKTIDIKQCPIATDAINDAYDAMRQQLLESFQLSPAKGASLLLRHCDTHVETSHRKTIHQTVNGITFHYTAGEFFQTNPFILTPLVTHVLQRALGDGCRHLVDAYCGCGLFSISAHMHFEKIIGIEISNNSILAARKTVNSMRIKNVEFICGKVESIFAGVRYLPPQETVVILDPPRKGCDDVFLLQLFDFAPKKIVYVACDPTTQMRDAAVISANGYDVVDVTPFDMFPQTKHMENVITFLRR